MNRLPLPPVRQLKLCCLAAVLLNSLAYILLKTGGVLSFGGAESGNDSEYYHSYAVGIYDNAVNIWPELLRLLYSAGLYSREIISVLLFFLYLLLAYLFPLLAFTGLDDTIKNLRKLKSRRWFFTFVMLLYPTPFLMTLDIYRDIFMFALLTCALYFVLSFLSQEKVFLVKCFFIAIFCLLCFLLLRLRPYLGFSVFSAVFIWDYPKGNNIYRYILIVFFLLIALKASGLIDPLLIYRGEEGFSVGQSSFGLGLANVSAWLFPLAFLKSILFQFFGFYIHTPAALAAFTIESIPFILVLYFIYINRRFMDRSSLYLLGFILVYSFFVGAGNDNLGTALRLRLPSYLIAGLLAFRISCIKYYASICSNLNLTSS